MRVGVAETECAVDVVPIAPAPPPGGAVALVTVMAGAATPLPVVAVVVVMTPPAVVVVLPCCETGGGGPLDERFDAVEEDAAGTGRSRDASYARAMRSASGISSISRKSKHEMLTSRASGSKPASAPAVEGGAAMWAVMAVSWFYGFFSVLSRDLVLECM